MRILRTVIWLATFAGVFTGGAFADATATPTGTWNGSIAMVGYPSEYRPSVRLVVGSAAATAVFRGLTGATHDASGATTSCTVRYRLLRQAGSSFLYVQQGKPSVGSAGYVANSPCVYSGGNALRLTRTAARLRGDFGQYWTNPVTFDFSGSGGQASRGYLQR